MFSYFSLHALWSIWDLSVPLFWVPGCRETMCAPLTFYVHPRKNTVMFSVAGPVGPTGLRINLYSIEISYNIFKNECLTNS